jgi:ankyrin repeat protein
MDRASELMRSPLGALFRAIVSRDRATALRILAETPALAGAVVETGDVFFDEITHYAYGGDTALHMAAAAYVLRVAGALVANGASVRARNRRGAEPLHYAADGIPGSRSWDPEAQGAIVRCLIAAGADPNAVDKSGVAPLHRAVRTRSTAAVRALLEGGADVRLRNKSGSTPLHLAARDTGRGGAGSDEARQEQATIVQLLLDHGAR